MNDLVERLRRLDTDHRGVIDAFGEAADEIERLRHGALLVEIADLHIKIGSLKAALRTAVPELEESFRLLRDTQAETWRILNAEAALRTVRAALKEQP